MADERSPRTIAQDAFQEYVQLVRSGRAPAAEAFAAGLGTDARTEFVQLIADWEALNAVAGPRLKQDRVVGDFRLLTEIGRGGSSAVWEAEQLSLRRRVALKLLHAHLSFSANSLRRFENEASAAGRLLHPHIATVYEVGETDGVRYIAEELVQGGYTLHDRLLELRDHGELDREYYRSTAELFAKLADALECAHRAGVIHRDVKPGNVLLTPSGQPKLADFGLAKVHDQLALSRTGDVAGTPYYMSPEQALGRRGEVDARSDVFSLGATLYEALTLVRPFDGDSSRQVIDKLTHEEPAHPTRVRSRVPLDLAVVALKALEKRRESRYASAGDMAADLRRFLADQPILARPPSALGRGWRWCKRHRTASVAGVVLSLALAVVSGLSVGYRFQWERAQKAESDNREMLEIVLAALDLLDPATPESDRRRRFEALIDGAERAPVDDPSQHRRLAIGLGSVGMALGFLDVTDAFLQRAVEGARVAIGSDERLVPLLLARSRVLHARDRFVENESTLNEALRIVRDRSDTTASYLDDVVDALNRLYVRWQNDENLAQLAAEYGSHAERLEGRLLTRSLDAPDRILILLDLAEYWNVLGDRSKVAEAYRRARAEVHEHGVAESAPLALEVDLGLAFVENRFGRLAAADELFVPLLQRTSKALGWKHPLTLRVRWRHGVNLLEQQRLDDSRAVLEAVLVDMQQVLGLAHIHTLDVRNDLALIQKFKCELSDAERSMLQLLPDMEAAYGRWHRNYSVGLRSLAEIQLREARFDDALRTYGEALDLVRAAHPPDDPEAIETVGSMVGCCVAAGQYDRAVELAQEHLRLVTTRYGQDRQRIAGANLLLSMIACGAGNAALCEDALKVVESTLLDEQGAADWWQPTDFSFQVCRALRLLSLGRVDEAEELANSLESSELHPNVDATSVEVELTEIRARIGVARGQMDVARAHVDHLLSVLDDCDARRFRVERILK